MVFKSMGCLCVAPARFAESVVPANNIAPHLKSEPTTVSWASACMRWLVSMRITGIDAPIGTYAISRRWSITNVCNVSGELKA